MLLEISHDRADSKKRLFSMGVMFIMGEHSAHRFIQSITTQSSSSRCLEMHSTPSKNGSTTITVLVLVSVYNQQSLCDVDGHGYADPTSPQWSGRWPAANTSIGGLSLRARGDGLKYAVELGSLFHPFPTAAVSSCCFFNVVTGGFPINGYD